uniref:Macro domain-containing protein n=1 Tax=Spongospora subterranea TaxID=70186 RepID=A0A0H5RE23_9EUKA|eukprot:CRZ12016.1 hypothetical protein [Spongospora subterranea]
MSFLRIGDITRLATPAIILGSNIGMIPRRGASRAIYHAAGHRLIKECRHKRPAMIAKAVTTTAGDLPANALVHMPLPDLWSEAVTTSAYFSALNLAAHGRLSSVAFSSLKGCFHDEEVDDLARVAVRSLRRWADRERDGKRLALDQVVITTNDDLEYERMLYWMYAYFPSQNLSL